MKRRTALAAACASLLILSRARAQEDVFKERRIATAPGSAKIWYSTFSPDGRWASYTVLPAESKQAIGVNDVIGEPFDWIQPGEAISKNADWIAYFGDLGDETFLIVNGKKTSTGPKTLGRGGYALNAVSKRTIFTFNGGPRERHLVVDGARWQAAAHDPSFWTPVFSEDGKTFAVRCGRAGKWFVFVEGQGAGEEFDRIDDLHFAPDGRTVVYRADDRIVIGAEKHPFFGPAPSWPTFSRDGKHHVYRASEKKWAFLVIDGKRQPAYDEIGSYGFAPDDRTIWFEAVEGKNRVLVVGEERTPLKFGKLESLRFSPDGKSMASVANGPDGYRCVQGDRTYGPFRNEPHLVLRPDGQAIAFIETVQDHERVWVGEKAGRFFTRVGNLVWSGDSRILAFRIKCDGEWRRVVFGNEVSEAYDEVGPPQLSPDGSKVAFGARRGREFWWKVLAVGKGEPLASLPFNLHDFIARAIERIKSGDLPGAIEDLSQAITMDPGRDRLYYERGRLRERRSEKKLALEDFTKALELDPKSADYWAARGNARIPLEDAKGALADLNKAIELSPKYAWAYSRRAWAHFNLGDHTSSLADFTRAIELRDSDTASLFDRGHVRLMTGDDSGALQDFTKCVERAPGVKSYVYERGLAHTDRRDWAAAIADFKKACELDPKFQHWPRLRLWVARSRSGERQAATRELKEYLAEQAASGKKDDWELKLAAYGVGDLPEANLLKAIPPGAEADARTGEASYFIGIVHLLDGNRAKAKAWFSKSVETANRASLIQPTARAELKAID